MGSSSLDWCVPEEPSSAWCAVSSQEAFSTVLGPLLSGGEGGGGTAGQKIKLAKKQSRKDRADANGGGGGMMWSTQQSGGVP